MGPDRDFAPGAKGLTFNPFFELDVATPDPNTPSDYTVTFGVPAGDVNFGGVVAFIPQYAKTLLG